MCVCLFSRRKGGIERKVTKHNKTRGWETSVNFTTRGSSVVKITCVCKCVCVCVCVCVCACGCVWVVLLIWSRSVFQESIASLFSHRFPLRKSMSVFSLMGYSRGRVGGNS